MEGDFDYAEWSESTLHPEDVKAFNELLGGSPTLENLLKIQEVHLSNLEGPTPGANKRVWAALVALQNERRIIELTQMNMRLQGEVKQARATATTLARGAAGGASGTIGMDDDDTWEEDFKRLEGVLHDLRRMNEEYPIEEDPLPPSNPPETKGEKGSERRQLRFDDETIAAEEAAATTEGGAVGTKEGEGGGMGDEKVTEETEEAKGSGVQPDDEADVPPEVKVDSEAAGGVGKQEDAVEEAGKDAGEEAGKEEKKDGGGTDEVDMSMFILGGGDDEEEPEQKLDPKDFIVKGLEGETVIRNPGQLMGQSFVIEGLKDCYVLLLDHSGQVSIDDCTGCVFYVGPCEGSLFIRNCTKCKVIASCNQFRTRDCEDMDVLIHCAQGQPIIETSTDIRFGPFDGSYKELTANLSSARMSPWDTDWTNVHDFNPPKTGEDPHWTFLGYETTAEDLLGQPLAKLAPGVGAPDSEVIPRAWGDRDAKQDEDRCFLAWGGAEGFSAEVLGDQILKGIGSEGGIRLVRSRTRQMSEEEVKQLSAIHGASSGLEAGYVIAAEFAGVDATKTLTAFAEEVPMLISTSPEKARKLAEDYFGALRHMSG